MIGLSDLPFFSYQPKITLGKLGLDRIETIDRLWGLGRTCLREALPTLEVRFLFEKAEPFAAYPRPEPREANYPLVGNNHIAASGRWL